MDLRCNGLRMTGDCKRNEGHFMRNTLIRAVLVAAWAIALGSGQGSLFAQTHILLAGDSTVTDDSGWGKGFAELLTHTAQCTNLAKSGRSSRSYRTEGWWKKCIESKPDYLLIQFGHNDQAGKGPERESDSKTAFRDHLRGFVAEAQRANIQPILITSMTRRRWKPDGKIEPTLSEYAEATTIVARELNVPLIDLHQLSIEQCERIGPIAFRAFEPMNEKGADHTHLNLEGSRAVAPLVANALMDAVPKLKGAFSEERVRDYTMPKEHARQLGVGKLSLSESNETLQIQYDGCPMLTYNKVSPPEPQGIDAIYCRSGFLHPVMSPSGKVVTAAFPLDHAHQHGIFSAWAKTRWQGQQIDFWNLAKGSGRVLHQRVHRTFLGADSSVGFEVDLVHCTQKLPVVDILKERWMITAYPKSSSHFCFDLHSVQTSLTDSPLEIEKYHYGGIAYRGPVSWLNPNDGDSTGLLGDVQLEPFQFLTDEGQDRIDGNGKPTKWVVASGVQDGQPVSMTVLCHAQNFRAPQTVRLHPTKPYFAYSPCVLEPFSIDARHPYVMRYRFLVADMVPDSNWIRQQWEAWHRETQPRS